MSIKELISTLPLHLPVSFDDIILTEEEQELALKDARVKKFNSVEEQRKRKFEEEKRKDPIRIISTAAGFWKFCKQRADVIVKTETGNPTAEFKKIAWQDPVIKALGLYFMGNPEFDKLDPSDYNDSEIPFDLNKGLYIFSPPGCGKTLLMDMFRFNPRQCYALVQCSKLALQVSREGEGLLSKFCNPIENGDMFPMFPFGQKIIGVCYNDLGTEHNPVQYFGNKLNVMEKIMLDTYDRKIPWSHRHVTTNLTAEQMKEKYGIRVTDRFRQIFNIIDLKGKSLR